MKHIKSKIEQTLINMIWPAIFAYMTAAFVIIIYGLITDSIFTLYVLAIIATAELTFITWLDSHSKY